MNNAALSPPTSHTSLDGTDRTRREEGDFFVTSWLWESHSFCCHGTFFRALAYRILGSPIEMYKSVSGWGRRIILSDLFVGNTHAHTHTLTHSLSLSQTHTLTLSLSLPSGHLPFGASLTGSRQGHPIPVGSGSWGKLTPLKMCVDAAGQSMNGSFSMPSLLSLDVQICMY